MENKAPISTPGMNPIASIFTHPKMVVAIALVIIVIGVPFAWVKGTASYTASALVQISPRYMKNMRDDQELNLPSPMEYIQYVKQQTQNIRRFDLMYETVKRLEARGIPWVLPGEKVERAAERLGNSLIIAPIPESYTVQVSLNGKLRWSLAAIVNTAIEVYIEHNRSELLYGKDQRDAALNKRAEALQAELDGKMSRRTAIAQQLGVSTFSPSDLNPFDKLYVEAADALLKARRKRMEAEAKLRAFDTNGEQEPGLQSPKEVMSTDPAFGAIRAALLKRRTDALAILGGLQPEHPNAISAAAELKEVERELDRATKQAEASAKASIRSRLMAAVDLATRQEREFLEQADAQKSSSTEHAKLYSEALGLNVEITRISGELEQIAQRRAFFLTEKDSPGLVYVALRARDPLLPSSGGRAKLALIFMIAGVGVSLIAAVGRDFLTRKVMAPRQLEKAFGFAPLAWLAEKGHAGQADHNARQMRHMASNLLREHQSHAIKKLYISMPDDQGSATSLIFGIGHLLIELGIRPVIVRLGPDDQRFATSRPSFVDALQDRIPVIGCVVPGAHKHAPPWIRGGTKDGRLPTLKRLNLVLDQLAEHFDLVLIEGVPVLNSPDIDVLLGATDSVVLVFDHLTALATVKRSAQIVTRNNPKSVGVVLQGINPWNANGWGIPLVKVISGHAVSIKTMFLWSFNILWTSLWRQRKVKKASWRPTELVRDTVLIAHGPVQAWLDARQQRKNKRSHDYNGVPTTIAEGGLPPTPSKMINEPWAHTQMTRPVTPPQKAGGVTIMGSSPTAAAAGVMPSTAAKAAPPPSQPAAVPTQPTPAKAPLDDIPTLSATQRIVALQAASQAPSHRPASPPVASSRPAPQAARLPDDLPLPPELQALRDAARQARQAPASPMAPTPAVKTTAPPITQPQQAAPISHVPQSGLWDDEPVKASLTSRLGHALSRAVAGLGALLPKRRRAAEQALSGAAQHGSQHGHGERLEPQLTHAPRHPGSLEPALGPQSMHTAVNSQHVATRGSGVTVGAQAASGAMPTSPQRFARKQMP